MFQSPVYNTIPLANHHHSLPPLSQITSALPFAQHQNPPSVIHQQLQQHQPIQHFPPTLHQASSFQQQYASQFPSHKPLGEEALSPPTSPKYTAKQALDRCTCKHDGNHIPRPRNAFILFRQQHHQSVLDEGNVIKTNPDVSRELGKRWRDLDPQEKGYWNRLAEEEKKKHAEKYPGYRYIPRRFGKKGGCPFCKSKQSAKAAVGSANVPTSPETPPRTTTTTTTMLVAKSHMDDKRQSEEHAIAQSFLNLRNQAYTQSSSVPPYAKTHYYVSQPQEDQQQPQQYPPQYQLPHHPYQQHQQQQHLQQPSQSLSSLSAHEIPRPALVKTELPLPLPVPVPVPAPFPTVKHNITNFDSVRSLNSLSTSVAGGSPPPSSSSSSSHKAGSIASFLN